MIATRAEVRGVACLIQGACMRIAAFAVSVAVTAVMSIAGGGCGSSSNRAATMRIGDDAALAMAAQHDPDPNNPKLAGNKTCLSIMTFNMAQRDRPKDFRAVADDLCCKAYESPDFILLQEVLFERDKKTGPEPNTAAALAADLGYFCRATQRDNDDEGIAILSRYPFVYYEARQLKAQTTKWALGKDRVSVMGEFKVPDVGLVRVTNVHLTNWAASDETRAAQLTETLQWIAARQEAVPADVILLGGDFNTEAGWHEMNVVFDKSITGGLVFRDYNDRSQPTFGKEDSPTKRLDYIFVATPKGYDLKPCMAEEILWRQGLLVPETKRHFMPSDHAAVLQRFAIAGVASGATAKNAGAAQSGGGTGSAAGASAGGSAGGRAGSSP
jgi:endonuclease/exonuclease/phosphatase family metal-dependent hydrolase